MIGYMSLEEQVDRDFERARRRSLVAWLAARLRGVRGKGGYPRSSRCAGLRGLRTGSTSAGGWSSVEGRGQR